MSEIILSNHNGTLTKLDSVENGRQKYELTDLRRNSKTIYSVAEKDVFEYEKTAKESINYMSSINPNDLEKRSQNIDKNALNKKMKINSFGGGILGAIIPAGGAALLKTSKKVKLLVGIPLAIAGAVAGFMGGIIMTSKNFLNKTVPELKQINKFAEKLNKLDIKVESEQSLSENKPEINA